MANTYTQLHIQFVIVVKGRQNLIPKSNKEELHKYITGIVQKRKHKMLAINSVPDHLHMYIGMHPDQSVSDLMRDVKTNSSIFINDKKWLKQKFQWQAGYGAFSYSKSHSPRVIQYVLNQELHHKKRTFREEYLDFLNKFGIKYDERYLFEFYD